MFRGPWQFSPQPSGTPASLTAVTTKVLVRTNNFQLLPINITTSNQEKVGASRHVFILSLISFVSVDPFMHFRSVADSNKIDKGSI